MSRNEREFIKEFIEAYKSFPCLWKVKSKDYSDRNAKSTAYEKLVTIMKKAEPAADRDLVVKKINILRTTCRKEFKKVLQSEKSGAKKGKVYIPHLWYFDLMRFTRDQEILWETVSNLDNLEASSLDEFTDETRSSYDSPLATPSSSTSKVSAKSDKRTTQTDKYFKMSSKYLVRKHTHCSSILDDLLKDETFTDVILTAEGQHINAHRVILCLASPYFQEVLNKDSNAKNVIFFRDMKYLELKNLITFIYTGEVSIDSADLQQFLKTAELLKVTSLCEKLEEVRANASSGLSKVSTTISRPKRLNNNSALSPPPKSRKISKKMIPTLSKDKRKSSPSTSKNSASTSLPTVKVETSSDNDLEMSNTFIDNDGTSNDYDGSEDSTTAGVMGSIVIDGREIWTPETTTNVNTESLISNTSQLEVPTTNPKPEITTPSECQMRKIICKEPNILAKDALKCQWFDTSNNFVDVDNLSDDDGLHTAVPGSRSTELSNSINTGRTGNSVRLPRIDDSQIINLAEKKISPVNPNDSDAYDSDDSQSEKHCIPNELFQPEEKNLLQITFSSRPKPTTLFDEGDLDNTCPCEDFQGVDKLEAWESKDIVKFESNDSNTVTSQIPHNILSPFEYFNKFFNDDMLDQIVSETNLYLVQQNSDSTMLTSREEIKDFLSVLIYMGVVSCKPVKDYWNPLIKTKVISDTMTRKRFLFLNKFIHFNDNDQLSESNDKFYKIRPMFDLLRRNCLKVEPLLEQKVDEVMIPQKETHSNKPSKWGYKLFCRTGSDGIVYDFILYQGKTTFQQTDLTEKENEMKLSSKIATILCKTIPDPGNTTVYGGSFFTDLCLINHLNSSLNLKYVGIAKPSLMVNIPLKSDALLQQKSKGSYHYQSNGNVIAVKWYGNECVNLLSNAVGVMPLSRIKIFDRSSRENVDVACPAVVEAYDSRNGAFSLLNILIQKCKTPCYSKKWYFPLFNYILDLSICNAYLLYLSDVRELGISNSQSLRDFRLEISEGLRLIGRIPTNLLSLGPASTLKYGANMKKKAVSLPINDSRFDQVGHFPITDPNRNRCSHCQLGLSRWKCSKCSDGEIFLCLSDQRNCFYDFHTKP